MNHLPLAPFLITLCLFYFTDGSLQAQSERTQDKLNIFLGFGYPDLINIGIRFQLEQAQMGISFGYLPDNYGTTRSYTVDLYNHFGRLGQFSTKRQLYIRNGVSIYRSKTERLKETDTYFNSRFGKEIYFNKNIGFQFELGVGILLFSEQSNDRILSFPAPLFIPSIGVYFFYRI